MLLAALLLAAPAAPTWPSMAAIESAVRSRLRDPDSAKFNWPYAFVPETRDMANGHHFDGRMICGTVNARNGYGGYSGPRAVMVLVENDGTIYPPLIDVAGRDSFIGKLCADKGEPVD